MDRESNRIKTKAELQVQTGKNICDHEYQEIIRAVQHYLQTKGTSLKDLPNPGEGPNLEGLTRMLGWEKKGSKHFYTWLRAKINTGGLTKASEGQINTTLGTMQSLEFLEASTKIPQK